MLLSTQTLYLANRLSHQESIRIIKEAGFDAYDVTLLGMYSHPERDVFAQENFLEIAKELRGYADSIGIVCNQAHAPLSVGSYDEEAEKRLDVATIKSMEIASILGAKIIVVHPKNYLSYPEHVEELFDINVKYYKALIPYAEKYNIKVAIENLYQRNNGSKIPSDATCSRSREFCRYLDAIDSEWVVGCLDVGHASLMGCDIPQFIKDVGNKRLQALHVHDTDLIHDTHTMPFEEKIDYLEVAKALGEIDYQGDFTFEADVFFHGKPQELYLSTAKYMCEVGRFLVQKINDNRP